MGLATTAGLTACSDSSDSSGKPTVVASTNVWGSVAAQIAGQDADIESIINSPTEDPHEYQTTPSDAAHIRDASLVIVNGGDYDEFAEQAADGRDKPTINAVDTRKGTGAEDDENEHVWYDVNTVGAVADKIAHELGGADPAHAQAYTDRAAAFRGQLTKINDITARIAAEHPKSPVLQTEPIGHYLLQAAGATDRTPHAFAEAVEQGTDPAPADVATVRELVHAKQIRAVIYNKQTEGKTTADVADTARKTGVPVVEVTETLPEGTDYVRWQTGNAQALADALN